MTVTNDALDLLAGDPPRYPKLPNDFHRHPTTGAPYVTHPETGKRVMYGRPSSFGSALDNPFNLVKWKERQLLIGASYLALDVADKPGTLLDFDVTDRDWIDGLAARCHDAAGSHLAADQGTHIHRLLERYDKGEPNIDVILEGEVLGIPRDLQCRILEQWIDFRSRHGLTALAVEQTVVNDRWRLAGTLDRLDVADRDILTAYGIIEAGVPFVGDIKTGGLTLGNDGQPNYWVKYPVQLAAYVDAVPYDTDTDERGDWDAFVDRWPTWTDNTETDPYIALIYHYDLARALAGEVVDWQIIPVNVDAGREGGDLCRAAADFAKRRDLFAMPAPSAPAAIPPAVEQATDPEPPTASSVVPGSAAIVDVSTVAAYVPMTAEVWREMGGTVSSIDRDRLRDRIRNLITEHPEAEILLRAQWPDGVPTLKHDGHNDDQLEQILAVVRRVEAEVVASWVPGDVTSRSGAINRARKAWADSGRDESELWFAATVLATYEQCKDPDCTLDGLIRQFTIEQAERLREQATAT